ncbi:hypothetical protein [uncultured Methylobacterium sp.]|jgi:predicted XRE-type DNA-binding protein|uniref:hypothetical protein n=1 Tax=uncultured Methylobacterium sp. TaxID=157278 RepID=UPI00260CF0B3|nr:hypothetical protein [uncultured Methylobacterium sp.]
MTTETCDAVLEPFVEKFVSRARAAHERSRFLHREAIHRKPYESVWDAPGETAQEAANLKARSALPYEIRRVVESRNLPQEVAARLGLTSARSHSFTPHPISLP